MAKIMIFDVPATFGGALTILEMYHKRALEDKDNDYVFVVSTPKLEENDNVKVLNFPSVKKSWFHRYSFDTFKARKIVKEHSPDKIISLQNLNIKGAKLPPQQLYVHQPLPFVKHRFKFFSSPLFWVYQNIISRMIFKSIKKAQSVIVQTRWMKEAIVEKCEVEEQKILIEPPPLNNVEFLEFKNQEELEFFYPAAALSYKNHIAIVNALITLKEQGLTPKVIFTLDGTENKLSAYLKELVATNGLNIEFAGSMPYGQVLKIYSKSALIFPSFIETFGLPLLEARLTGSPIIASDEPFSREILEDYDKVKFFNYDDNITLTKNIKTVLRDNLNINAK